jgi:hypothetical protein
MNLANFQGNSRPLERETDTPNCVYSAHLRLLAAILKTAVIDWNQLKEDEDPFCDRSHTAICVERYFDDGEEELGEFFDSEWFERICLELSINPDAVYRLVELED